LNIDTLPLDDKKTFDLLSSGETTGVFQLESGGMRRSRALCNQTNFRYYRYGGFISPGPNGAGFRLLLEGKHNPDKIVYATRIFKARFGGNLRSHGLPGADFTNCSFNGWIHAKVRRTFYAEPLQEEKVTCWDENKKRFTEQSIAKGYTKAVADKVWGFIEAFC